MIFRLEGVALRTAPVMVVLRGADGREVGRIRRCSVAPGGLLSADGELPEGAAAADVFYASGRGDVYGAMIVPEGGDDDGIVGPGE